MACFWFSFCLYVSFSSHCSRVVSFVILSFFVCFFLLRQVESGPRNTTNCLCQSFPIKEVDQWHTVCLCAWTCMCVSFCCNKTRCCLGSGKCNHPSSIAGSSAAESVFFMLPNKKVTAKYTNKAAFWLWTIRLSHASPSSVLAPPAGEKRSCSTLTWHDFTYLIYNIYKVIHMLKKKKSPKCLYNYNNDDNDKKKQQQISIISCWGHKRETLILKHEAGWAVTLTTVKSRQVSVQERTQSKPEFELKKKKKSYALKTFFCRNLNLKQQQ